MKIAITGVTGFIGQVVAQSALDLGHQTLGIGRSRPSEYEGQFIEADLTAQKLPSSELKGVDLLIHLAVQTHGPRERRIAETVNLTKNVVESALEANVKTIVLISSLSVLKYQPNIKVINDSTPVCEDEDGLGDYAAMKLKQEQCFIQSCRGRRSNCVIVRPGLVYSQGNLSRAHAGLRIKNLYFEVKHDGLVPLVSLENTATAILKACDLVREPAEHLELNLVDDNLPTQSEYLSVLKRQTNPKSIHIPVPSGVFGRLVSCLDIVFGLLRLKHKLPESLQLSSFQARFCPYTFDFSDSKKTLGLEPANSTASVEQLI